jgi:hypothetical protein
LFRRGTKIYVLRSPRLVKRFRDEDCVEKSDENDAIILMEMPKTCFKELTVREVTLLQLIDEYENSPNGRGLSGNG